MKTADDLRRVGFAEEQANMLAQKFEETAQAQSQDLKEFIRGENTALESRMNVHFQEIRTELHASLRDQMVKFVTILMAMITLAVAVIKLFPNIQ